jgi:hypothetical protein
MTRYRLNEKNGMIMVLSGHSTKEESLEVLGKSLCINSERLCRSAGVEENEIYECKNRSIAAILHNLKKVDEKLANGYTNHNE